jgi:hypothetical protein
MRGRGEDGERHPVHHRRAEPAHEPRARAIFRQAHEVDDVLDDREAGPDGKARDDRVELEADAVQSEQPDDDEALDRLLDPRRDEAAVIGKADRQRIEQAAADRIGSDGGDAPEREQQQNLAQTHQLERVEPDEDRQQDENRRERKRPMGGLDGDHRCVIT